MRGEGVTVQVLDGRKPHTHNWKQHLGSADACSTSDTGEGSLTPHGQARHWQIRGNIHACLTAVLAS